MVRRMIGWDLASGKDETVILIPPSHAADENFMRELRRHYPDARVVISQSKGTPMPREWTQDEIDAMIEAGDDDCPMCGGTGVYEGECECGDDTCCCLVPTPITCPECGGRG